MATNNKIPNHGVTKNEPGLPKFPGRNTPLVVSGPPKNVPAPAPAAPATAAKPTEKKEN